MMMSDKAQPAQLRKMRFALIRARAHLPAALPPIFALTDPVRTPNPLGLAKALPRGAGLIYRHFGADNRLEVGRSLARIAARRALILLIGNDPQLAMKVKASGVHWPEAAMVHARRWRSRFPIMTCAAHSRLAIVKAGQVGLNAALISTVFPSQSSSSGRPIGARAFRQHALHANLPLYALGGVKAENVQKIADFGGIAAIGGAQTIIA